MSVDPRFSGQVSLGVSWETDKASDCYILGGRLKVCNHSSFSLIELSIFNLSSLLISGTSFENHDFLFP